MIKAKRRELTGSNRDLVAALNIALKWKTMTLDQLEFLDNLKEALQKLGSSFEKAKKTMLDNLGGKVDDKQKIIFDNDESQAIYEKEILAYYEKETELPLEKIMVNYSTDLGLDANMYGTLKTFITFVKG